MKKILIIDDDPDITEAISTILTQQGFETKVAHNSNDGEKLVLAENPDLIILDVMMDEPDDGFFLDEKLRKEGYSNPIVMLTSISKTLGFEFEANEFTKVDRFLEKPISPQKLIEIINELIIAGREK